MDGRVEQSIYVALTAQFRKQDKAVARELELRMEADLDYMDEGIAIVRIGKDAKEKFLEADLGVKKHLLSAVLSNCSFRDRNLSATYCKPFDIIVKSAPADTPENNGRSVKKGQRGKWQGSSDSNRGPSVLETDALTS